MVYNFFDKKSTLPTDKFPSSSSIKSMNISNKELDEELHKPIIRKFKKKKYTHLLYAIFEVLICN